MSRESVELVRRGCELFAAGDLEGVTRLFADDADLADDGGLGVADTPAGARYGPEGYLQSTEDALEVFEDYPSRAEHFSDLGEAVVVAVRISGRWRASG